MPQAYKFWLMAGDKRAQRKGGCDRRKVGESEEDREKRWVGSTEGE